MTKPKLYGSLQRISSRLYRCCWLQLPALCLFSLLIGLQALGIRQLIAAEAVITQSLRSVVVIDSQLVTSIPKGELAGSQIIAIDGNHDVIEQITAALDGLTDIEVVRVISHGSDGKLWFGGQALDASALDAGSARVAGWGRCLAADGEILLYGCRVAETNQGRSFVKELAALTHAKVAASTNVTGMGGDTDLEFQQGQVTAAPLVSAAMYEQAGVSLQAETSDSTLTSWTSNQNGTITATMEFNLRGRYYYGYYSTDGDVYMYLNNRTSCLKKNDTGEA
jgi:hypothetical protein